MLKSITFKSSLIILFLLLAISSCSKNEPSSGSTNLDPLANEKAYAFDVLNDIYYWYKDVPQNIKPGSILSLENYYDTLLVPQDRWSWMMTGSEYLSMETGQYETYGASFSQAIDYYNDYSIKVRYVFDNSPMSENGIKRGYTLTNLNDIPVSALIEKGLISDMLALKTNSFTFRDLSGASIKFAATARIVNTKSSLKTLVFTSKEFPSLPYPVGYFNYYTFNSNMISDINDAMNVFKTAGIEELILDLRYNGGGELKAMSALANFIATSSSDGQLLCRTMHNDKYRSLDSDPKSMTYIKRATSSLNLKRIFILTSHGSASASEVLLNGLRPLMSVIQVGTTSYGKPNGMYVIPYPEGNYTSPSYVFLPICFYTVNKNGMGNFENGLVPDHYRPDDLYHDFGMSEDWTKACLTYIVTGKFPALPPTNPSVKSLQSSKRIPLEEDKSNYGKLSIKYPF